MSSVQPFVESASPGKDHALKEDQSLLNSYCLIEAEADPHADNEGGSNSAASPTVTEHRVEDDSGVNIPSITVPTSRPNSREHATGPNPVPTPGLLGPASPRPKPAPRGKSREPSPSPPSSDHDGSDFSYTGDDSGDRRRYKLSKEETHNNKKSGKYVMICCKKLTLTCNVNIFCRFQHGSGRNPHTTTTCCLQS